MIGELLNWMTLEVFSKLGDSMILRCCDSDLTDFLLTKVLLTVSKGSRSWSKEI